MPVTVTARTAAEYPQDPPAAPEKLDAFSQLEGLTPEELKRMVVSLQTQRKLGLYWERDQIARDRALNAEHVFLRRISQDDDTRLDSGEGPWPNLIIEGDNFDALRLLRRTHAGRIRVILIDPPYNTGAGDWVYNDRFVRKEDRFRASQWLEFLYRRLELARDLLSDDGAILVCINDENRSKLELLMDEVFEGMRIGSFVWKTRSGSNDQSDHNFSVDHEHVLVYGRAAFEFTGTAKDFRQYRFDDNDGRGPWKTGDLSQPKSWRARPRAYYPLQDPDTGIWYPCNPNRVWAYASEARLDPGERTRQPTMEEWIRQRKVVFPGEDQQVVVLDTMDALLEAIDQLNVPTVNRGRTPLLTRGLPDLAFWVGKPIGFGRPWFKRHLRDVRSTTSIVSSWIRGTSERSDAGDDVFEVVTARSGTSEDSVKEILGYHAFDYPKPPSLIRELLRGTTDRNDIILDFFAGSGTTAHAVLALNAEDEGERRFILVSSTEAHDGDPHRNLCRDVCAARVRRVIDGYGNVPGLGGSFAYARMTKVAPADFEYEIDGELIFNSLCLLHGGMLREYSDAPVQVVHEDENTVTVFCSKVDAQTPRLLAIDSPKALRIYSDRPEWLGEQLAGLNPELVLESLRALQSVATVKER
jgi:adenine-specific DNA-methyltransferase